MTPQPIVQHGDTLFVYFQGAYNPFQWDDDKQRFLINESKPIETEPDCQCIQSTPNYRNEFQLFAVLAKNDTVSVVRRNTNEWVTDWTHTMNVSPHALYTFCAGPTLVINTGTIHIAYLHLNQLITPSITIDINEIESIKLLSKDDEWKYLLDDGSQIPPHDNVHLFYKYTFTDNTTTVYMLKFNTSYTHTGMSDVAIQFKSISEWGDLFPCPQSAFDNATCIKVIEDTMVIVGKDDQTLSLYYTDGKTPTQTISNLPGVPTSIHDALFGYHQQQLADHYLFVHYQKESQCTKHNLQRIQLEYKPLDMVEGILTGQLVKSGTQVLCYGPLSRKQEFPPCQIFTSGNAEVLTPQRYSQEQDNAWMETSTSNSEKFMNVFLQRCEQLQMKNNVNTHRLALYQTIQEQANASLNYLMDSEVKTKPTRMKSLRMIQSKGKIQDNTTTNEDVMEDDSMVDLINPKQMDTIPLSNVALIDHNVQDAGEALFIYLVFKIEKDHPHPLEAFTLFFSSPDGATSPFILDTSIAKRLILLMQFTPSSPFITRPIPLYFKQAYQDQYKFHHLGYLKMGSVPQLVDVDQKKPLVSITKKNDWLRLMMIHRFYSFRFSVNSPTFCTHSPTEVLVKLFSKSFDVLHRFSDAVLLQHHQDGHLLILETLDVGFHFNLCSNFKHLIANAFRMILASDTIHVDVSMLSQRVNQLHATENSPKRHVDAIKSMARVVAEKIDKIVL